MRRRHFIAGAGAAAAAGALTPARAQVPPGQQPIYPINPYPQQFLQQVSIGVNVTLSGDLQKYGQEVVKGVQAAVDEQNRFNAPVSHVWALRTYDDRNDPAQAIANVSVAGSDSTVVGMIGNLTGAMTLAALSRYANQSFAVIVPTVTTDAVTARGYHNVYRLPTKDSTAGQLFANTVLQKRGEPVLAVAFDGDYGYDVARGFVQQAKTNGHPADVLLFPADKTDPAQAARTVLDRSPGYVFLCGKTGQLGPIAEALRLAGYTGDFGASDGFYNMQTIQNYARTLDGAMVASSMPPLDRIPTSIQLVTDFEREVTQVTAFSAYSYAAAQLIIAASQRGGNSTTRTQLLLSLQEGGMFTTLVGQFSFNISGDPLIPNIYLYTIGKDGFKYARPAIHNGFVL